MTIKEIREEHFPLCESLYLKSWDRPFSATEFSAAILQDSTVGSICFDSRGYARAFAISCVLPKLTSIGHFAAINWSFIEPLLRPILTKCETSVQLVVPDGIYDNVEVREELTKLGFKGSGVIVDEVDGDLVKFVWEPTA